ncbi:MAG TPA: GAF domain-containing protein [Anaerolineae bacterium]|nr:GAF domain-containing protein [Anaerolineae bacterium]HQK13012.1 GAF domain-containing protein [Anaerolineae bacterium]
MTESKQANRMDRESNATRNKERTLLERRMLLAAGAAAVAGSVYLVMAVVVRAWQLWAVMLLTWLIACASTIVYRMARREKTALAANVWIIALTVLLPAYSLFLENAFWALIPAVLTFPIYIAALAGPGMSKRWIWIWSVLGAGFILLIELLHPLPRYTQDQLWTLRLLLFGMLAFGLFIAALAFVRTYRHITSIRTRLIITSVLVVLLVAGMLSVGSVLVSVNNVQRQTFEQLRAFVALKKTSLTLWFDGLQSNLNTIVSGDYEVDYVRTLTTPWAGGAQLSSAQNALRMRFIIFVRDNPQFDELFLMGLDGKVLMSSDRARIGKLYTDVDFLKCGMWKSCVRAWQSASMLDLPLIVVARPVLDRSGQVIAVLAGRINMEQLSRIIAEPPLGETGETYLVAANHRVVTQRRFGGEDYAYSSGIDLALYLQQPDLRTATYADYRGVRVLGVFTWLPDLQMALLSEINRAEVLRGMRATIMINTALALVALLLAGTVSYFFAGNVSAPIVELAQTATRIAAGEYELTTRVQRNDEIGVLAQAFNSMTGQLRELIASLEQRIEARTRGLETVAEVARATTSVLDPNRLLPEVVNLVKDRFGFYYVGLFLVDAERRYAVLRAGTGEAGRQMLAQGWQLAVGMGSMIGQCVATGKPLIRQKAGDAVVRFENPFLPDTRSELALPLRYGGRTIGAMTVQSTAEAAFDEASIVILQNMADQVAVAVENARLFAETQAALQRAQEVQRRYQGQAWRDYLKRRTARGYELRGGTLLTLGDELPPGVQQVLQKRAATMDEKTLLLPIVQGDQVIGVLGFESEEGRKTWSTDEVTLIESLSEQLLLAAENQRLLDETQRRAARERLSREVTAEMRRSLDVTTVLRTAIRELQESLNLTEAEVWIETGTDAEG